MPEQQPNPTQERVERDVRLLIGDLHMQLIVMRAMLEQQQQGQVAKPNGGFRDAASQSAATQGDVPGRTGQVNTRDS